MKTSFPRVLGAVALSLVGLLAIPGISPAKDHDGDKYHHGKKGSHHKSHHSDDYWRRIYFAHPRHGYRLSFGIGYAGTGYYYGPPGASYYYQGPGVIFYGERRAVPREYLVVDESYRSHSVQAAVQRALALRGYNPGPIDGAIGPMSQRAIARYQRDNGLPVTGRINSNLLDSLDLG